MSYKMCLEDAVNYATNDLENFLNKNNVKVVLSNNTAHSIRNYSYYIISIIYDELDCIEGSGELK